VLKLGLALGAELGALLKLALGTAEGSLLKLGPVLGAELGLHESNDCLTMMLELIVIDVCTSAAPFRLLPAPKVIEVGIKIPSI
jgi:hypothetical protein